MASKAWLSRLQIIIIKREREGGRGERGEKEGGPPPSLGGGDAGANEK